MNKRILPFFCCGLLLCAACGRPEDESPSKFQRQANIEKYVQKAKSAGLASLEREKPLPVPDPIDPARLSNITQEIDPAFLTQMFEHNRRSLEKRLLETYGVQTSALLAALMNKHRLEALEAAKKAGSPADLAQNLRALLDGQNKEIQDFIAAQTANARLRPDQDLLDRSKARLNRRCEDFLARIQLYYGNTAASGCRPVLGKAVEDYVYAMASAGDSAELDAKLAQIETQAESQIKQITAASGDPLGVTPEPLITALRADMITAHQKLESRIEALYGKDAVLASRKVFNRYLEEGGKTLRENARLSQKKRGMAHLSEHYRESMLALQRQWNEALEASSARPPGYALSSL